MVVSRRLPQRPPFTNGSFLDTFHPPRVFGTRTMKTPVPTTRVDVPDVPKQDVFTRLGGSDRRIELEYADARRSISPVPYRHLAKYSGVCHPEQLR